MDWNGKEWKVKEWCKRGGSMQEYEHLKVNLIIVISCECCNEKFVWKYNRLWMRNMVGKVCARMCISAVEKCDVCILQEIHHYWISIILDLQKKMFCEMMMLYNMKYYAK